MRAWVRSASVAAALFALPLFAAGPAKAGPDRPAATDREAAPSRAPDRQTAPRGPVKPDAQGSKPSPFVFVPTVPPGALAGAGSRQTEPVASRKRLPVEKGATARPGREVDRAPLPGTFRAEPAAVPSPFARTQIIDQRSNPDLEVGVAERTTLGVFSEAGAIERTDVRNSTVRETRDLGAGLTLQYKFGQ